MALALECPKSGLVTEIFERIEDIPSSEWKSVFPDVLENYAFFKSLDESGFKEFTFYYLLVYEDGDLVAATSCFFMDYPLETTVSAPFKALIAIIQKIIPSAFHLKAVICGLPMDQGRIGISSKDPRAVMQEIVKCMEGIAKKHHAGIVAFKDFNENYAGLLDPLQEQGFYKIQDIPSTDMDINFGSFDEYLTTLSRPSRDGFKRKLKKIKGLNVDLKITNRLEPEILTEVYRLYLQTVRRGEDQFEVVPMKFFERVAVNMPEETYFFLWSIDQKLVAFAYCLVAYDHFIDLYLGFDYEVAYDYHLYFIRYRDLMNWCLEHSMKKYEMGPTGYEAKRRLGFKMIPLYIYAKHRSRRVNPFFHLVCRMFKPENFHPVFKAMKKEKISPQEMD